MNVMNKFITVLNFVPRKAFKSTQSINKALEAPLAIGDTFESWVTKVFGTTSACALFGKDAFYTTVVYTFYNSVCVIISCIGCSFDALQFVASFVPGPNFTVIVTLSCSTAFKVFVWSCKNQTLLWKVGCIENY